MLNKDTRTEQCENHRCDYHLSFESGAKIRDLVDVLSFNK